MLNKTFVLSCFIHLEDVFLMRSLWFGETIREWALVCFGSPEKNFTRYQWEAFVVLKKGGIVFSDSDKKMEPEGENLYFYIFIARMKEKKSFGGR